MIHDNFDAARDVTWLYLESTPAIEPRHDRNVPLRIGLAFLDMFAVLAAIKVVYWRVRVASRCGVPEAKTTRVPYLLSEVMDFITCCIVRPFVEGKWQILHRNEKDNFILRLLALGVELACARVTIEQSYLIVILYRVTPGRQIKQKCVPFHDALVNRSTRATRMLVTSFLVLATRVLAEGIRGTKATARGTE